MKFVLFGAGFWAKYQLAAWQQTGRAECVMVCDPNEERARALAEQAGIAGWTTSVDEALACEADFVDIVAPVEQHAPLTLAAAAAGRHVICQKPLGESLDQARAMAAACREAGVHLLVHENYRWQSPVRALKKVLASGVLGTPFRAQLNSITSYPVLANQPALGELEEYILMDMGTHVLDMARFLFGEARVVYCQAHRAHASIKGEDAATVVLKMESGLTVVANIAEAETPLEQDPFTETMMFVEGDLGSAEVGMGFELKVTTKEGTVRSVHEPARYSWAHPDYRLSMCSMPDLLHNLASHLEGTGQAETTAADNLKTLELVAASYRSFRTEQAVRLPLD